MNKKTVHIIVSCCGFIAIIATVFGMYYGLGDTVLFNKGNIRTLWICSPVIIIILDISANILIEKIYKNKN